MAKHLLSCRATGMLFLLILACNVGKVAAANKLRQLENDGEIEAGLLGQTETGVIHCCGSYRGNA